MAALLPRVVCNLMRRSVLYPTYTARRCMSDFDAEFNNHDGKKLARSENMADYLGHSSGMERAELITEAEGFDHKMDGTTYENNVMRFDEASPYGNGTLAKPFKVYCVDPWRHVECICSEEDGTFRYTFLTEGQPAKCYCGFWFNLERKTIQEFVPTPEDVHH
ncbi:hypothetical protein LOTGIDRAFT_227973 [Lottia gigantea]|uniref:Uncharacterized protein n=1 Tax=Lottia gigantea TaxID=225164 RepID=V4AMF6_LOTGI|nr:hypothetical protein LOTGIDRAFT_227973 [Lottia gigantea]ESP05344.1 hypothetical protein LOTGIDRAFT_227973 [Lottia gigantea]